MAFEQLVADGLSHVGGGVVIALADHILYRAANSSAERTERKREVLAAAETILDAQPVLSGSGEASSAASSHAYAEGITAVREYLVATGHLRGRGGLRGFVDSLRSFTRRERINPLGPMGKLGVATAIELLYDTGFWMAFYTHEWQMSPIAAFSTNLYQIPCLWLGLVAGGGVSGLLRRLFRSGEERRLDAVLGDLLRETPILERVVTYEPPSAVRSELAETNPALLGARLTRGGRRLLASASEGARRLGGALRSEEGPAPESEIEAVRRRYQEIRDRYRKG